MSTSTAFKFEGPKQPRAPRISAADWENRKPRLRELYDQKTLTQLMEVMTAEGLEATPKQYDYQFRKWGWQKYGRGKAAEDDPVDAGAVSRLLPTFLEGETATESDSSKKRPQSIQSIETNGSVSTSPVLPPKKKAKWSDKEVLPQNYGPQSRSAPSMYVYNPVIGEAHRRKFRGRYYEDNASSGSQMPIVAWTLRNLASTSSTSPGTDAISTEAEADSNRGADETTTTTTTTTTTPYSEAPKARDLLRSIQSFQADKKSSISALVNFIGRPSKDSYQRHLDKAIQLTNATRNYDPVLLRRCPARAAQETSQRKFVRKVLISRMKALFTLRSMGPLEEMLSRMLLAQSFAQDGQSALSKHLLDSTPDPAKDSGSVGNPFILLAYLHYKHPRPRTIAPSRDTNHTDSSGVDQLASVTYQDFCQFAYSQGNQPLPYRREASSRNDPITVISDYVRTCIHWCSSALWGQSFDKTRWTSTDSLIDDRLRMDILKIQTQSDEDLLTSFLQHLYLRTTPTDLTGGSLAKSGSPVQSPTAVSESEVTDITNLLWPGTEAVIVHSTSSGRPGQHKMLMREAAISFFKHRFSLMGSELSLKSRGSKWSYTGSVDEMSDMLRDSLSISDSPKQDQTQQSALEMIPNDAFSLDNSIEGKDDKLDIKATARTPQRIAANSAGWYCCVCGGGPLDFITDTCPDCLMLRCSKGCTILTPTPVEKAFGIQGKSARN
ncbi:hypothetical protein PG997_000398 [Apiospora hydei]|uniref:Clr5 domain-containing protein n=1 Tax=Apiospora hydei TaxID=1337664 RepID=A0ABR1XAL2_9PEZI